MCSWFHLSTCSRPPQGLSHRRRCDILHTVTSRTGVPTPPSPRLSTPCVYNRIWHHRRTSAGRPVVQGEHHPHGRHRQHQHQRLAAGAQSGVSADHTDLPGVPVSRRLVWHSHGHQRLLLRMADVYERVHLRRFNGIRHGESAALRVQPARRLSAGPDGQRPSPVLWTIHARQIQRARLEAPIPDFRYVRRDFLPSTPPRKSPPASTVAGSTSGLRCAISCIG